MDMNGTPCVHEPLSPVVQRCCDARNRIFRELATHKMRQLPPQPPNTDKTAIFAEMLAKVGSDYYTQKAAATAYRYAMPDPSTRQGLKEFIACVLHGMAVSIISHKDGAALLSGARIALSALRGRPSGGVEKANKTPHTEISPQPSIESAA
jgi:hypothetical protein